MNLYSEIHGTELDNNAMGKEKRGLFFVQKIGNYACNFINFQRKLSSSKEQFPLRS